MRGHQAGGPDHDDPEEDVLPAAPLSQHGHQERYRDLTISLHFSLLTSHFSESLRVAAVCLPGTALLPAPAQAPPALLETETCQYLGQSPQPSQAGPSHQQGEAECGGGGAGGGAGRSQHAHKLLPNQPLVSRGHSLLPREEEYTRLCSL